MQSKVRNEIQNEENTNIAKVGGSRLDHNDDKVIERIAEANSFQQMGSLDEGRLGFCDILRLAFKRRFTALAQEGSVAYMSHLV